MKRLLSILIGVTISSSIFASAIPFYNNGFECWEQYYLESFGRYTNMPSGWDLTANSYPVDLRKEDNYHITPFSPRSGQYALFFFDTSFHRPVKTKGYTLSEGTYTYSVYASQMGWANTYVTLTVEGGITKSQKFPITGSGWQKVSITFTLEEEATVYLGMDNTRTNDGNGTITHFIADDCELTTTDGKIISSEYDFVPSDYSDYTFYVYNSGDAELVRCNKKEVSGKIELPATIVKDGKSYKVRKICESAFEGCTNISEIVLPNYLLQIDKRAFYGCTSLATVVVSNRVTDIAPKAFGNCTNLSSIELLTKSIPNISSDAFPANSEVIMYVPDITTYSSLTSLTKKSLAYLKSPIIYDGKMPQLMLQYAPGVSASNIDSSSLEANAGEYNIPATFTHSSGISVNGYIYIEIEKKDLLIMVNDASRRYGDDNPKFEVKYSGFINDEDESVLLEKPVASTSATPKSDVGTYPITVSGGSAKNYILGYKVGVLTVNKASLSAKVVDVSRLYGAKNPDFSLSYQGLKNNETAPKWTTSPTFTTDATTSSGVGEYPVNATANPTNYALTISPGIQTVKPAPLVMKAENVTRKYYEDDPVFSYTCSGFVNNEDVSVITTQPSFSTESDKSSDVGTYTITPYGAVSANYAISYKSGTLTITQRDLTVIAEDKTREYGDVNPLFTFAYQGFVCDDDESVFLSNPNASCTAMPSSNVGTYTIESKGGSAKNYKIKNVNGTLTIQKAPLTIYVNDCQKVYGSDNPTFSSRYGGLKNGESEPVWITKPTYTTEASKSSDVGTYEIKLVNGQCKNYDATFVDGILTITKAQLIVKPENKSRLYYDENPRFTYKVTGLRNTDDISVLTKEPILECNASLISKAGTYTINASGAEAGNYEIGYEEGTLTIEKRTLSVTPNDVIRKYGEENPELKYVISGFVNNEDNTILSQLPDIYTNATNLTDVGSYAIYAKDASADNYKFNYKQGTLTIEKANQTITWEQEFNGIEVGDQIELLATSSSGLDIEYVFETDIVSLYIAGEQQFLDCLASGTFSIRATQSGNKNYNPAVRIAKTITVGNPSGISTIVAESFRHPVYFDLSGKRILSLPQNGVVIRILNGKKEKKSVKIYP